GEVTHGGHDRREPGDRPGSQVVAVGEPAGDDDRVDAVEVIPVVEDDLSLCAERADRLDDVHLAVGAGEGDDRDVHRHAHTAPDTAAAPEAASTPEIDAVEFPITGVDSNRCQTAASTAAS